MNKLITYVMSSLDRPALKFAEVPFTFPEISLIAEMFASQENRKGKAKAAPGHKKV